MAARNCITPGTVYSRLTVVGDAPSGPCGAARFRCVCVCGTERIIYANSLKSGTTKSCGCLAIEKATKHGHINKKRPSKEYVSWAGMIARCTYEKHNRYKYYGGRGIKVCDRWNDFRNFLADMGERPKGNSLDRVDINKDYCPENCRWADNRTQARNKSTSHYFTFNGETIHQYDWEDRLSLKRGSLRNRVRLGWSIERILTTGPIRGRPKRA